MSRAGASPPAAHTSPSAEEMLEAYRLKPPASAAKKKPKLRQPRDCSQTVAAAKKKAKAREAAAAKALGADPEAQRLQSLDERRTGLRNLGATCYMNSLVQTLFMNPAFRRGIYAWAPPAAADAQDSVAQGILRELQLLFACLQRSHTTCYDPERLVKALNLDTTQQQDAQEFNKLLLTYLEGHLKQSADAGVAELVQDQFLGRCCYRTTCQKCGRDSASSAKEYPFYELELNLNPKGATLDDSLRDYVKQERLEGVECAHCASRQDATRQMALLRLPPCLTLQLLRFVYDLSTGTKKKVSVAVKFPEKIDLSAYVDGARAGAPEHQYQLTAVLMHTGNSANSGHYTARILQQTAAAGDGGGAAAAAERWWNFNDERVTLEEWEREGKKGGTNAVGVTLLEGASTDATRLFSSKTAYMLNYTRVDVLQSQARAPPPAPPADVHARIEQDVRDLEAEVANYKASKESQETALAERKALHDEVGPLLAADAPRDARWMDVEWLQRAMSTSIDDVGGPGAIDTTALACPHGCANPQLLAGMKLVGAQAYALLKAKYGHAAGPELTGASLCEQCCRTKFEAGAQKAGLEESGERMAALLKAAPPKGARGPLYGVDGKLKQQWKKWQADGRLDANAGIYCACTDQQPPGSRKLAPGVTCLMVSAEAKDAVELLFPETQFFQTTDRACADCTARRDEFSEQRSLQKEMFSRLYAGAPLPPELPLRIRVLPGGWREAWVTFVDGGAQPPPVLRPDSLLSEDGKLSVHPELCDGPWLAFPPSLPLEGSHAFRSELRSRLAAQCDLVTQDEYDALLEHGAAQADADMPSCTVEAGARSARGEPCWTFSPPLSDEGVLARREAESVALRSFERETVFVQQVRERATAEEWVAPTAPNGVGPASDAAVAAAAAAEAEEVGRKRPRRSCRSNAGAKIAVTASATTDVNGLKLRLLQQNPPVYPSQACLYFEGRLLDDDAATLAAVGVLAGATVQLFVDKEIEADEQAALEQLGKSGGGGGKGKKRAVEDGFAGSLLLGGAVGGGGNGEEPIDVDAQ